MNISLAACAVTHCMDGLTLWQILSAAALGVILSVVFIAFMRSSGIVTRSPQSYALPTQLEPLVNQDPVADRVNGRLQHTDLAPSAPSQEPPT